VTDVKATWRRCGDVAWIGDEARVIAARTSPPDLDGPRILEGAAAGVWLSLADPHSHTELAVEAGRPDHVEQALNALFDAGLIEPA
jgi:hypothetical protein